LHSRFLFFLLPFLAAVIPANATPVRVCTMSLPPQTMQDSSGMPDGYATRILQEIARRLDWTLEISYMPWLRVVDQAKNGRCDVVYTVLKRTDYEKFMVFPKHAVLDQVNVLITLKNRKIRYDGDLESFMHQYSIGLYRDKALDDRFEVLRNSPWAKVDPADTPYQNMKKLIAGRFDAAIENNLTAIYELRRLNQMDAIEILQPALNITPAYIVFPKAGRLTDSVEQFDDAMETYVKSKAFKDLNHYYLDLQ